MSLRSANSLSSAKSSTASRRRARLAPAEAHHHAVEDDVLARGELGVEAHAELDERRQAARPRGSGRRRRGRCSTMIFSSVLLPEPLRPTIPKNSPWWTSNEMSRSARCSRYSTRRNGCVARSLNESTRCSGIRNVFSTPRASITTGGVRSHVAEAAAECSASTVVRRHAAPAATTRLTHCTRPPMIAFGIVHHPARTSTARARSPGSAARPSPTPWSTPCRRAGTIFESYNALLDRAAAREDLEALVLVHQDAEIVDADLCATIRAALARPRRRRGRLRRRDRRPQHRLVGGVGDARLVHPPLRGARRRRPARVLVGLGRRAAVRAHRRGRDARRLPARALSVGRAQRALRRVARRASTATTSTSASRSARRAARSSPPTSARSTTTRSRCCPTRRSGSRRTCASPRSGTAGCRASGTAPGTWQRAGAARRGRARRRARDRLHDSALEIEARIRELERALAETRDEHLVADHGAAAAVRRPRPRRARDDRLRQRRSRSRTPTGATPGRASSAPPSRTRSVFALAADRSDLRAATTCSSTQAAGHDGLEALVLVHPGRRDRRPRLLRQGPARRSPTRTSARRLRRRHRRAQRRVVGGRRAARAGHAPLQRVRRRRVRRRSPGRGRGRRPARSTRVAGLLLVLSPWAARNAALRRGAAHRPRLRRRLLRCRSARPGRKVVDRRPARDPPPRARAASRTPDVWVEAHIELAEKWDGRMPGAPGGRWTGRQRARRPRPSARPRAPALLAPARSATPRAAARARLAAMTEHARLAAHRAAARGSTRSAASRRKSSSARRISSLRDHGLARRDAGADPQLRQPLGDRERARLEHAAAARPPGAPALLRATLELRAWAMWSTRLASSRSSIGLRSHGSRIARERVRPRRVERATPRRSRRTRDHDQPQVARVRRRSPRPP